MKATLRYLLMVVAMVSVLGVYAQSLAQQPEATMQSTSTMVSTGSSLPQAAVTGATLAGETPTAFSPGRAGKIRKGDWNPGGEPGPDEGENSEPWEDPIGDGLWVLMLLAGAYLIVRVARRRALNG